MNALRLQRHPQLRDPVVIAAFEGWNDGGNAPSMAVKRLVEALDAQAFADIDPEEFYVFTENRPTVHRLDEESRYVEWQRNRFYHAPLPGTERDAILFLGVEPNLRWRTYAENFAALARQCEAGLVVTLGAYLADVLYTLPVQLNAFTNDPDLRERFALKPSNYEGPTGIVGTLSSHCMEQGLPTLSLWAGVPYYISIPNPKAALAHVSKLREILGFSFDAAAMETEAEAFDNEINDVVAKNPNVAAYVRELKKREFLN